MATARSVAVGWGGGEQAEPEKTREVGWGKGEGGGNWIRGAGRSGARTFEGVVG